MEARKSVANKMEGEFVVLDFYSMTKWNSWQDNPFLWHLFISAIVNIMILTEFIKISVSNSLKIYLYYTYITSKEYLIKTGCN